MQIAGIARKGIRQIGVDELAGMNLKDWLAANKLTQEQFEQKSGIPQSTISRICQGGDSTDDTKRKIYETTNGEVTPNWLVLNKAA